MFLRYSRYFRLLILLRHGKNTVDLALPVRLANLPAGAKLEIYKITASEGNI